ncbi:MAG: ATP-binding protein [Clostridia bacterium]|nr:ATP-binding protein [Clostridia bacterium]
MAISKDGREFSLDCDFVNIVSNCYFVDKSLFLRDLIDGYPNHPSMLFTRPRRFGKSLNISMLQTFFEKTDEDNSIYFKNLEIWKCGEKYTSEQGKYPVIYLDFKECESDTFEGTMTVIKDTLAVEFARHKELGRSRRVERAHDRKIYKKITEMNADADELKKSLSLLCRMLYAHHGVKPIILIDEYDVPIQNAYEHKFYAEMTSFFRDFLSAGLKVNKDLHFAVITGAMRIAKASIFTGLNNLGVYSVLDDKYSQYFGFTKDEIIKILDDFGHPEKFDEICEWYDGYHFGKTDIFNPWSVSRYFIEDFTPARYWLNSSGNTIIKELLKNPTEKDVDMLRGLLNDVPITGDISEEISYGDLNMTVGDSRSAIYSVMLATGYLTAEYTQLGFRHYVIPNEEVKKIYRDEIITHIWGGEGKGFAKNFKEALASRDAKMLEEVMKDALGASVSGFDLPKKIHEDTPEEKIYMEKPYHTFVEGFSFAIDDVYMVRSNEESGLGRFDIAYLPRNISGIYPGVIIEFEVATSKERMNPEAEEALSQIDDKMYDAKLLDAGVKRIDKYAMVFYGKEVKVVKKA